MELNPRINSFMHFPRPKNAVRHGHIFNPRLLRERPPFAACWSAPCDSLLPEPVDVGISMKSIQVVLSILHATLTGISMQQARPLPSKPQKKTGSHE